MKIIFLDIDGVLNSSNYFNNPPKDDQRPYPLNEIDPEAIKFLNKIILKTNSRVVVSSSWRLNPGFENLFERFGIESPLYGVTPSNFGNRGREIFMYLMDHPEITEYVILDDYDFPDQYLESEPLKGHFVQTLYSHGLGKLETKKAIEILGT